MPQGLQVWDAAGNLIVDVTSRLGKILGVTDVTAGVDGSVTNANFAAGSYFFVLTPIATYSTFRPTMSFNAGTNTLSWAWEGRPGVNCKLVYGVY